MNAKCTRATIVNILNCNDWFQVSGILFNKKIIAKKLFSRVRTIPPAQVPSVSKKEPELEVASSSRKSCVGNNRTTLFNFE